MIADRLFAWLRSGTFFLRLTLFTRILLAAGFIPTGWVKLMGLRFTSISVESPIGAFFEALYATGPYWRFLGASQLVAGLLLLHPRLAHLGAALFVPIIVNIVIITVALGFRGTPMLAAPMLLAVTYLCLWDYDRFRSLFTRRVLAPEHQAPAARLDPLERAGFWVFGLSLMTFFLFTRGLVPRGWAPVTIATGTAAGLFTLLRYLTTGRRLTPHSTPD